MGAVHVAPDSSIIELRWHLLSKHGRWSLLFSQNRGWVHELAPHALVALHVLYAFHMNAILLRQVTLLTHLIHYFEVVSDLVGWWQSCSVDFQFHAFIKVVLFVLNAHLLSNNPLVVDSLIIHTIKIAHHVIETFLLFILDRWLGKLMLWLVWGLSDAYDLLALVSIDIIWYLLCGLGSHTGHVLLQALIKSLIVIINRQCVVVLAPIFIFEV